MTESDTVLETTPLGNPDARLDRSHLQLLIRDYNQQRHWSPEGYVPAGILQQLALDDGSRATRHSAKTPVQITSEAHHES